MEDQIRADLAARYPQGYWSFTRGGKRFPSAVIRPVKIGYTVNVNGSWHVYDHWGVLLSTCDQPGGPRYRGAMRLTGTTEQRDGASGY